MNNCEYKLLKQTHKLYYQGDKITKHAKFYIILFGKLALVRHIKDEETVKRIIGAYTIGRTVGEEVIVDQKYKDNKADGKLGGSQITFLKRGGGDKFCGF